MYVNDAANQICKGFTRGDVFGSLTGNDSEKDEIIQAADNLELPSEKS